MSAISLATTEALSPLDGRYRDKITGLAAIFSEGGLIKNRLRVEAAWLCHLSENIHDSEGLKLSPQVQDYLQGLMRDPQDSCVAAIKAIESRTNHDVKAVEYYLQDQLRERGASDRTLAFVHFGCTSEDINNLSYGLMLAAARREYLVPVLGDLQRSLATMAKTYRALPMLARTHGQSATPTTLGKELAVFVHRLDKLIEPLASLPIEGKINGAVGNFNAHHVAFPEVDWPQLAQDFVANRLQLHYNPLTTQIENHDSMVSYCSSINRINTVLVGLCRDLWTYVSLGYFKQKTLGNEVGSSTMPHKVNPIDFENAEGNFGLANALAGFFAEKLPISRLQRDLSDSTVQRSLGSCLGHSLLGYQSLLKGLAKLVVAEERIAQDLASAHEVLAEAAQTIMRRYGIADAYDKLKEATRGQVVTREALDRLMASCREIPAEARQRWQDLSPETYTGLAADLCDAALQRR